MAFVLAVELALWLAVHLYARRKYGAVLGGTTAEQRWNRLLPAFMLTVDKLRLWQRAPAWTVRLHHANCALLGSRSSLLATKLSMTRTAAAAYCFIAGFTLLAAVSDGLGQIAVLGPLTAALVPFAQLRMMNERLQKRRRRMLQSLPEVVTQVLLLTNAGEAVQQALATIAERHAGSDDPLQCELEQAVAEFRLNVPLGKALDDFQKRCGLQEATVFVSTLLLHYKRGGDDLVVALRTLSKELWDKRKALSRTLGEEASAKLVFPMVIVFLIVLVVIASPAIMLMNASS